MHDEMISELLLQFEGSIAFFALVRLIIGMPRHMILQSLFILERRGALSTGVRSLVAVSGDVIFQVFLEGKSCWAQITLVRLLHFGLGVFDHHVAFEVVLRLESGGAHVALVRFFIRVGLQMSFHLVTGLEPTTTNWTLEIFRRDVPVHMRLEVVFELERS